MKKNAQEFRTFRGYALARSEENLTPGMEDYLEMIRRLSQQTGYTRVSDLARFLNVKPPSVTNMIRRLCERGLLHYEPYGVITLTSRGQRIGNSLLQRHQMLEKFLHYIGVSDYLLENVERIEHNLTPGATQCLFLLVEFMEENPTWMKQFAEYCRRHQDR